MSAPEPTGLDLEAARAFVSKATWQEAVTFRGTGAEHEYVVRMQARRQGLERLYVAFVELIRSPAGYDRRWHSSVFRSLDLDEHLFWLMTDDPVWVGQPIDGDTCIIINRARRHDADWLVIPGLEVDR